MVPICVPMCTTKNIAVNNIKIYVSDRARLTLSEYTFTLNFCRVVFEKSVFKV